MSSDFVRTVLLAIGALLPIVDPLGSAWNGIRALLATLPNSP